MNTNDAFLSIILFSLQIVGMVGFYVYYTYRNKKAEKEYWQKVTLGKE